MAYTIIKTDGTVLTSIPDGTVNTEYSTLTLPGRNYTGYGQSVDTNFIHQLESYAYSLPPANPLRGQLWYNTNNGTLNVCPTDGITTGSEWAVLTSTATGAATVFGNITVIQTANVGNLTISNNITADILSVRLADVTDTATIATATISVANINTLTTTVLGTGSTATAGTLTGDWTLSGNIAAGNLKPTAIFTDNYLAANGVVFQPLMANFANFAGNVVQSAQPNITSLGTLTSLTVTTGVTAGGTVTGGNLVAAANVTTSNISATDTATVNSLVVSGTSQLNAVGNVTITGGLVGQYLQTDGFGTLTWASVTAIANGTSNVDIPVAGGSVKMSAGGTADVMVISSTGAAVNGTATVSGDVALASQLAMVNMTNSASPTRLQLLYWDSATGQISQAMPLQSAAPVGSQLYWDPASGALSYL